MASLNKVMLIGNLTKDPELKTIGESNKVCRFGMAMNKRYKTESGEEKEEVCFLSVDVWGKQGELCSKYLKKGSLTFVEGRLQSRSYEKDGVKHFVLEVVADRVQFLDKKEKEGE